MRITIEDPGLQLAAKLIVYGGELRPVRDPITGHVQLYDIYLHGAWQGSRSTVAQAMAQLERAAES